MATAKEIIKRSLRLIGALSSGEEPEAQDYTDCLNALNTMIDGWNIDNLILPYQKNILHTFPSGTSFTIGAAGDVIAAKPEFIDYIFVNDSEIELFDSLHELLDHSTLIPGVPEAATVTYEPAVARVTFNCPVDKSISLKIGAKEKLSSFPDTTTDVPLNAGVKGAIESNLAMVISPEYGIEPSRAVASMANDTLASLKIKNLVVDKLSNPPEIADLGGPVFDITSG